MQRDRNADPTTIHKRAIATAQIDQIKFASLHALQHGVIARDPTIGQDKIVILTAPERPAVATRKR
jgi:hypothetical protein